MIKRFRIPLVCRTLSLYVGRRSYRAWARAISAAGCKIDTGEPPTQGGRCWGGWMWAADIQDVDTIFHEAAHALSNLYDNLGCGDEEEFRAYLSGHLLAQMHTWLTGIKNEG